MKFSSIIPLFCFLSVCYTAAGQTTFKIKEYTTDNGLPANGIKGLQWDENSGFLWIATEAGIVRFDGIYFKTYNKENTPFIASERMSFVGKNQAGRIYFADFPKNIITVEQNHLALSQPASQHAETNAALLALISEKFYLQKRNSGLTEAFAAATTAVISSSDTSAFFRAGAEVFYFALSTPEPVFCRGGASSLFRLSGKVYMTTAAGDVLVAEHDSDQPCNIKWTPIVTGIKPLLSGAQLFYENGMKNPIVFKEGNVWLLQSDGARLTAKPVLAGFPKDVFVKAAQYSTELNVLFIGTDSKGVMMFYPQTVVSVTRKSARSQNRNAYYSQVELANGNILTNEGDVLGAANTAAALPVKGKFGVSVYRMNDSLLWFHQYDAPAYSNLHQYNYRTAKTRSFPKIRYADAMTSMGDTLFAIAQGVLGYLDGDSLKPLVNLGVTRDNIFFSSVELSPGVLAIASCNALFMVNVRTREVKTILQKQVSCIRSLWKYKDYLFIGTYGAGFYIFKDGKTRQMPLDKNRFLLYTHCFAPDNNGFCFISTNRGLFKASLDQLTKAFNRDDIPVYYYYFGKNDGMQMTELNGGCTPCALTLANHTISFPSMDGLVWVDPGKAIPVLPKGEVFIDEIVIDDKKFEPGQADLQHLPPGISSIRINLALSSWCNQENIYLDYKLNNSGKWQPVSLVDGLNTRFENLAPGEYELVIRKLNGFTSESYTYQSFRFNISFPWYRTWWFYLLCLVFMVAVLYGLFRLRTRQYKLRQLKLEKQVAEKTRELKQQNEILEKNNSIKTRLISIISHDIITPLKFVTVAGKELLEKRHKMPESLQQEAIQEITNTSQELQLLSTNILNWIKYQNENRLIVKEQLYVNAVLQEVLSILQSLAKQKGLVLKNLVDPATRITQYYEPLKILLYNLVANAISFTDAGSISITSDSTSNQLVINVTDEGVGMSENQVDNLLADQTIITSNDISGRKGNGLGYLIIKDLIKMMDAQLSIQSQEGVGTTVSIIFPGEI